MVGAGSTSGTGSGNNKAWVVLLTRSNYLAATILLDYSLKRVKSRYPLHVLITPSLPKSSVKALQDAGCDIIKVDVLRPQVEVSVVAARFTDTWDKLRAFGLEGFEVCFRFCSDGGSLTFTFTARVYARCRHAGAAEYGQSAGNGSA